MGIEIIISIIAWFGAGAILAIWTYLDMKRRKKMERIWLAAVFFLSVIGWALYLSKVRLERSRPYQYPPPPEYQSPEYKLREAPEERAEEAPQPKMEAAREKPRRESVEGIPRCPHCGAAISSHEWECPKCGAKLRY